MFYCLHTGITTQKSNTFDLLLVYNNIYKVLLLCINQFTLVL